MQLFVVYLFSYCLLVNFILGAELPDYIRKCSLSDPNINECIKENGNLAIPEIVKGIPAFGLPSLEPARINQYHLNGCDFRMILSDVFVYGFENFKMSHVDFFVKNQSETVIMTAPYINITANYVINDGEPFLRTFHGGGKLNISLVDNVLRNSCSFKRVEKDAEEFVQLYNLVVKLSTGNSHYRFDDIDKVIEGDINQFIMAHTKVIEGALLPGIVKLIAERIRATSEFILMNVPFKNLFNP